MRLNNLYQSFASLLLLMMISMSANALDLTGGTEIHDPATIMRDGNTYWTFGTGDGNQGIVSRYSTDLINWQHGGAAVFQPGTWPNWINNQVAGFDGNFWAPDVIERPLCTTRRSAVTGVWNPLSVWR